MTLNKSMSLILLALTTTTALGQSSTSSLAGVKKSPSATRSWSTRIDSTLDRDLLKTSEADHTSGMNNSLSVSYITEFGSFTLGSSFYKSFVDEREAQMNDSSFSFSFKGIELTKGLYTASKMSLKIPTSELSRDYANLRTGASFSQVLSVGDNILRVKDLSLLTILGGVKNFHKYKTSLTGSSNTSHSLSAVAYLSYSVTEEFYLSLGGTYVKGWTYENNTRDLYSFSQAMGYSFSPRYNLEIGHEFGGTPLSPDGKNVEIEFFDERDSSVYASLTIKI